MRSRHSQAPAVFWRAATRHALTVARLASGAIAALFPALLAAQATVAGTIVGRVVAAADGAPPVPAGGAAVGVAGTTIATTSASDGRFVLERVPAGNARLRVELTPHRAVERVVAVPAGDTVHVEIVLRAGAQVLAPVRTVATPSELESFAARPNVGTISMGAAAMAGVPSIGEPDVVRVVQLLPGVVARNDYNTGLNVRGGEADQNLVLLDGHPICNPFHLGGLFSTFMDATVGGIDLVAGAFPARFGGRLSSVLDVRSADETRPGLHGSADLSALGATGRLASTLAGGDGSWSIAARRTYADAVTRIFTDNVFPYHFRDAQARATWAFPRGFQAALTAYLGRDVLDANLAELEADSAPSRASEGTWAFDWGNDVVGLALSKSVGSRSELEQRFSTSGFSTRLDVGDGAVVQRSRIRDLRAAGTLTLRGDAHDWSIGYDVATHRLRYSSGSSQTATTEFDIVQRPVSAALWLSDLWRASDRWRVEGGLRGEALNVRHWRALSPRGSVKFFVTPQLAVTAGAGRVTQFLHSLAGDGPLRYFDIWVASDSFVPVATAWHYVAGVERQGAMGKSLRIEGYVKRYTRVLEANWAEDPARRGDELQQARGLSYGVDLIARWRRGAALGGWVAYSYGVSSRETDTLRWAPGHDRRHDVDVVATWQPRKYRLGARFGYATGTPYTPIVGEIARRVYDPSGDTWGTGNPSRRLESLGGARNSARFPANHRLDLDASREFTVRGASVSPYVSVVNAYNAKNVFVYLYRYSTNQPTRRAISQFPILPSAGVRVAF